VKRTGRGESTGAILHIYMGTTQGNSLYSYLYLKLAKHHVSCFIFYVFFYYKIEEQEAGTCSAGGCGEKGGRMNMVQTMYTHVCKCKNDTC
jgi:hypothetical protein